MNPRLAAALAAAIAIAGTIAACGGGGEPVIHEDGLKDCLGQNGVSFGNAGQGPTGYAPIFHVAADFQGAVGANSINVFIKKDADRARGDAADARGALRAVGIQNPNASVVARQNVVVVFDRPPAAAARNTVRTCLD